MSHLVFLFYSIICDAYTVGDKIGHVLTWVLLGLFVIGVLYSFKFLGTPDDAPKEQ